MQIPFDPVAQEAIAQELVEPPVRPLPDNLVYGGDELGDRVCVAEEVPRLQHQRCRLPDVAAHDDGAKLALLLSRGGQESWRVGRAPVDWPVILEPILDVSKRSLCLH